MVTKITIPLLFPVPFFNLKDDILPPLRSALQYLFAYIAPLSLDYCALQKLERLLHLFQLAIDLQLHFDG